MRPRISIAAITALALLSVPAAARADGDPASDVLLKQDAFFPYNPSPSDGSARAVLEVTRRAREAGWPVKVAIIASPDDLGAVARMFKVPFRYAALLSKETGDPHLLVFTPNGFAGRQLGEDAEQKLESIEPAGDADGLTRQALKTIADLAEDAGHPVETPAVDTSAAGRRPYREAIAVHAQPQASAVRPITAVTTADSSDDGGGTSWLLFVIPLLLVAVVLGLQSRRERRR